MENMYFKRTKKKLLGTSELMVDIIKKNTFTHYTHKLDGTHVELHVGDTIKMITREGNDVADKVPYLVKRLNEYALKLAFHGVYACELVHMERVLNEPKDAWSASRRVLGCSDYNPNEPEINCIIYDYHVKDFDTSPTPKCLERRRAKLPKTIHTTVNDYVEAVDSLKGFYVPILHSVDTLLEHWETKVIEGKREGVMLCNPYEEIAWDKTFTKVKPAMDIDTVVMQYHLGKVGTKNEGRVGSIEVGVYKGTKLVSIGKLPSMNESERDLWTHRMQKDEKGCTMADGTFELYVIEAKCETMTSGMKMKFPSYVRERTDKRAIECLWEQVV